MKTSAKKSFDLGGMIVDYNNQTTPYSGWKLSKIKDELNRSDLGLFGGLESLYGSLEQFLLNSDTIKFID